MIHQIVISLYVVGGFSVFVHFYSVDLESFFQGFCLIHGAGKPEQIWVKIRDIGFELLWRVALWVNCDENGLDFFRALFGEIERAGHFLQICRANVRAKTVAEIDQHVFAFKIFTGDSFTFMACQAKGCANQGVVCLLDLNLFWLVFEGKKPKRKKGAKAKGTQDDE